MTHSLRIRVLRALGYLTRDGKLTARGQDYAEERYYSEGLEDRAYEGKGGLVGPGRARVGTDGGPGPGAGRRQDQAEDEERP
jgi:hypothetical protein